GGSPLYQACRLDAPESCRALLKRGASLVLRWEGDTPLEVAVRSGSARSVAVILEHVKALEAAA
ncbi:unnamed protein product, partial [Phaeothamnion confervicola]